MHYIYIIGVVLSWIIIALTLIHVILDNRQPAKTMAWALIILFVPVIGIIFYFFFGVNHRRERLVSQRSLDQLSKRSMLTFVEQQNLKVPETHKQMVDLFVNQSLSLPFKDNFVDIMTDGYAFFPELLKDIAKAKHHIHVDMYIFEVSSTTMWVVGRCSIVSSSACAWLVSTSCLSCPFTSLCSPARPTIVTTARL